METSLRSSLLISTRQESNQDPELQNSPSQKNTVSEQVLQIKNGKTLAKNHFVDTSSLYENPTTPSQGLTYKSLWARIVTFMKGRFGRREASRPCVDYQKRIEDRRPLVNRLATEIVAAFKAAPQKRNSNQIQTSETLNQKIQTELEKLTKTQDLGGQHYEQDLQELQDEILQAVHSNLSRDGSEACKIAGKIPDKQALHQMLFGSEESTLSGIGQQTKTYPTLVEDLARSLVDAFKSTKQQANSNRIQVPLAGSGERDFDDEIKTKLKSLTSTQKLAGYYFEEDLADLKELVVNAVYDKLAADSDESARIGSIGGRPPTKEMLEQMLFGTADSNLFDITFQTKKYPEGKLDKRDLTTSPFGRDSAKVREDTKAAFKTSSAMFVQESSKLKKNEPVFKKLDPEVETKTRRFFQSVRGYLEDCKERQRMGEEVDVHVLGELKQLLDKSFNPKFGGIGRFPQPKNDPNADKRFMGWAFNKFNPTKDLSGNASALNVFEQELEYYENNLDRYFDNVKENAVHADSFAIQVHGTIGQIFNDILFDPNINNPENASAKESTRLFNVLKSEETGVLNPELDLDKLTELQGRIRGNPLMMELNLENITGQVADKALEGLSTEFGKQAHEYRDILKSALMRSELTRIDTVAGRRGRFKDIEKALCQELSGRSDDLNLVMNMPDGNDDDFAQQLAATLCSTHEDGIKLHKAITESKIFGHGMRPITAQRDSTLPSQLARIAQDPKSASREISQCLAKEIGAIRDELTLNQQEAEALHEAIEAIKNGRQPPKRFDQKNLFAQVLTTELFGKAGWSGVNWDDPKELSLMKAKLGPLEDRLEVVQQERQELETRLTQTDQLFQKFFMASLTESNRESYFVNRQAEINEKLAPLQKQYQQMVRRVASAKGTYVPPPDPEMTRLENQLEVLSSAKEKARALARQLNSTDFASIKVQDQQGVTHKLGDLAEESTVSSMIHQAHQRTLCSISGTTTDIGLALYSQYGSKALALWSKELLAVADGKQGPADLPDSFREMFSAVSIFMQGGQYHTPAEVLGGMLIVAATLENPKEAANKELMETRYRNLLAKLETQPQDFLISDLEERSHFESKIDSVTEQLLHGSESRRQVGSNGSQVGKKEDKPDLSGLQTRPTYAFESQIDSGTTGIKSANLSLKGKSFDRENLRAAKKKQLQQLGQTNWEQQLAVAYHPGRSESTKKAMQKATTHRERSAILAMQTRTDFSILKDQIDILKGLTASPSDVGSLDPTVRQMEIDVQNKVEISDKLEHLNKALEATDAIANAIGVIKYSIGFYKAGLKREALSFQLEETERTMGSLKILEKDVEQLRENRSARKQQLSLIRSRMEQQEQRLFELQKTHGSDLVSKLETIEKDLLQVDKDLEALKLKKPPTISSQKEAWDHHIETESRRLENEKERLISERALINEVNKDVIEARTAFEKALTSNASQDEALGQLEEAYAKLAPKMEKLTQDIHDLRYKLAENSWKRYLRYPAGIISSGAKLLDLIKFSAPWVSKFLSVTGKIFGLFGIISAIASTVRVVKSGKKISQLGKEIKHQEEALAKLKADYRQKLLEAGETNVTDAKINKAIQDDADAASLKALLESSIDQLRQEKTDEWRDLAGEFLSAVSGFLSFGVALATFAFAVSPFGWPVLALTAAGLLCGLVGSGILIGAAIAKKNRGEKQANKMADLQNALTELKNGANIEDVKSHWPRFANIAKTGDTRQVLINKCEAYLQKRYINIHAQRTYNSLATELNFLREFASSKGVTEFNGSIPPASAGAKQKQYFESIIFDYEQEHGDGSFAKDFPTISRLRAFEAIGDKGIADIAWSGSSKEGVQMLLFKLGAKAVRTEQYTADSFDLNPESQKEVNQGLLAPTVVPITTKYWSGAAGVLTGLTKHASLIAGAIQSNKAATQSDLQFADALLDYSAKPIHSATENQRMLELMQQFTGLQPGNARNPDTILEAVMRKAGLDRHAQVSGTARSLSQRLRSKPISIQELAQKALNQTFPNDQSQPFIVSVDRYDSHGMKVTGVTVDPMGNLKAQNGDELAPNFLICDRGPSRHKANHVTYERIDHQWFCNSGGRRIAVELDARHIESKRSFQNPNLAERQLYERIWLDLHQNVVTVGYAKTSDSDAPSGRSLGDSLNDPESGLNQSGSQLQTGNQRQVFLEKKLAVQKLIENLKKEKPTEKRDFSEAARRLEEAVSNGYSRIDPEVLKGDIGGIADKLLSDDFDPTNIDGLAKANTAPLPSKGGLHNSDVDCYMNSALSAFRSLNLKVDVPGMPMLQKYLGDGIKTKGESRALREELARKLPDLPKEIRENIVAGRSVEQTDAAQVLQALLNVSNMDRLNVVTTNKAVGKDLSSSKEILWPMYPLRPNFGSTDWKIQDMVARELQTEDREGQLEFTIGEKTERHEFTTTVSFGNAPEKLVFQIGRFNSTERREERKVGTVSDIMGFSLPHGDKQKAKYELQSVVCHHPSGNSSNAYSGHYITYRRLEGNNWEEVNDGTITKFDITQDETRRNLIQQNCYIANYTKAA